MEETQTIALSDVAPLLVEGAQGPKTFDDLDAGIVSSTPEKAVEKTIADVTEATEAVKELGKFLKVKNGDQELELAEDAVVFMPVNGEMKEVKLSDLKTEVNGREYYHKKLTEVDNERKRVQGDLDRVLSAQKDIDGVDQKIKGIFKKVQAGDSFGALNDIVAMSGAVDPAQFLQTYLKQSQDVQARLAKMTPEQRNALIAAERAKLAQAKHKEELDKEKAELAEKKSEVEFTLHCNKLQAEHGISDQELSATWKALKEDGYFSRVKNISNLNDMATEVVGWISRDRFWTRIEEGLAEVDPDFVEDDSIAKKVAARVQLEEQEEQKLFTKQQIAEIVKLVAGKSGRKVSNQVPASSKHLATAQPVRGERTPAKNTQTKAPVTWDDID